MNVNDLLARCQKCNKLLTLDEMGCAICRPCEDEFMKRHGYSAESYLKLVKEISIPTIGEYEVVILQKGGWEKICGIVSQVKEKN